MHGPQIPQRGVWMQKVCSQCQTSSVIGYNKKFWWQGPRGKWWCQTLVQSVLCQAVCLIRAAHNAGWQKWEYGAGAINSMRESGVCCSDNEAWENTRIDNILAEESKWLAAMSLISYGQLANWMTSWTNRTFLSLAKNGDITEYCNNCTISLIVYVSSL